MRETYRKAVGAAVAVSTVAFFLFQTCPRQIIAIFWDGNRAYFDFAEKFFRIYLFFTFLNGIQSITSNFFTSIGKAGKGVFLSLTRQTIFLVPLMLLLPYFMGIDGIMYAAPVADLAAAVISVWFAAREFQKMGAEKPSKITVGN